MWHIFRPGTFEVCTHDIGISCVRFVLNVPSIKREKTSTFKGHGRPFWHWTSATPPKFYKCHKKYKFLHSFQMTQRSCILKYLLLDRRVSWSQDIFHFHLPWINSASSEPLSIEYYNLCVPLFTLGWLRLFSCFRTPIIWNLTKKMTLGMGAGTTSGIMLTSGTGVWELSFPSSLIPPACCQGLVLWTFLVRWEAKNSNFIWLFSLFLPK